MSSYVNFSVWIETEFLPYLLVAVCIVTTIISLVLNTALIMTLKKRNILCTPYGQFFLQFTIADFLACLTILIPTCVVAIMMSWELTAYSCYAQGVFTNLLYLNNFTIISFLVIERSVKVKNMELHKILFEPKRKTILLSVFIWIINIGISLIPLSDWVEISYHTYHAACVVRLSKSMYYLVAVFSVGIGISFCVGICTCPSILYKRAKEIRQRVNDSGIKGDYMSNKNTTNNTDYNRSHASNILGSEYDNIKQDNRNEKRGYQSHSRLPSRLQTAKQKFKAATDISKTLFVSDYTEDFRFASTVFIIWVVLIVCWLPYFVVVFYDSLHSDLWNGFYTVTLVVALPTYCIKPMIFLTYNRNVSSSGEQTQQSKQQSRKAKSFRRLVDKLDRLVFMSVKRQRTVDTSTQKQTEIKTKNQNYTAMKDSTSGKLTSVSAISNKSDSDRNISNRHESRKNTINNRRGSKDSHNPKKTANFMSKTVANGILSNNIKSERKVSTDGDKSNSFYYSQNDVDRRMPSNKRTEVNVNVRQIQVKPENTEKGRTENSSKEFDSGKSGIGGYSVGPGNDQKTEKRIEVARRGNPTFGQSYENHAAYLPNENMQRTVIVNKHRSDNVARTTIPMDTGKNKTYSEIVQSITATTDTTTSSSHRQSTNFVKDTKVRQSSGNFPENTNSRKQHSRHEVSNTMGVVAVKANDEMLNSVTNPSLNSRKSDNEQFYKENDTPDGTEVKEKINKHETDLSHITHENGYETLSQLNCRNQETNEQFSKNNAHETNKTRKHETCNNGIRNLSPTILFSGAFTENQTNNKNPSIIQREKNSIQKTEYLNNINTTGFEANRDGDENSNSELKGNKRESTKRTSATLSNKRPKIIQTQTEPISNQLTENTKHYNTPTTNKSVKETKYQNTQTTNKGVEETKYITAPTTNKSLETKYPADRATNNCVEETRYRHTASTTNKSVEETKYPTAKTTNKGFKKAEYRIASTNESVKEAKYYTGPTTKKSVEVTKYHTAQTINKGAEEAKYHTDITTNTGVKETKYHTALTTNKGVEETKYHTAPRINKGIEEAKVHTASTTDNDVEETKYHTVPTTNKGAEETKDHTASTTNKSVEEAKYHTTSTINKRFKDTKYHTISTKNKAIKEAKYHIASTANKSVEEAKCHTAPTTNESVEEVKYHTTSATNKGVEEAKYHIAPTTNKSVEQAKYNTVPTTNKNVEVTKYHTAPRTNKGIEETKYPTVSTTNKDIEEAEFHIASKANIGVEETKYHIASTANKSVEDAKYHTAPTTNKSVEVTNYYTAPTTNKGVEETKYHTASSTNNEVEEAEYHIASKANKGLEETKYHTASTSNKSLETKYGTALTTNKSVEDTKYNAPSTANKGVEETKYLAASTTNKGAEEAQYHIASNANKGLEETKYHTASTTNKDVEEAEYSIALKANNGVDETKHRTAPTTNKIVSETKYQTIPTSNKNAEKTKNVAVPSSNQRVEETKYQNVRNFHQIPQNAEIRNDAYCAYFEDQYGLDAPRETFSVTKRYSSIRNTSTTIPRVNITEKSTETYIVTAFTNVEQSRKRNRMALGSTGNDGYSSLVDKPVNIGEGKSVQYSDQNINFPEPTEKDTNLSNKGTLHYRNGVSQRETENTFSKYGNKNLHHGDTTFQNQNYDTRMKTFVKTNNSEKDLLSSGNSFKPESSAIGGKLLGPFQVTTYQKQNFDTRMKTFLKRNNSKKVLSFSEYYSNPESSATGGKLSGRFPYDIPVYNAPLRNTVTSNIDNGSMDNALLPDIAKDKRKKHSYGIYNSIHGDNNHFC